MPFEVFFALMEKSLADWSKHSAAKARHILEATQREGAFPFLQLPAELRERVYEHYFGDLRICAHEGSFLRGGYRTLAFSKNNAGFAVLGPPLATFLALTLVCRQIHAEARLLLFRLNTWYLHDYLDHELNRDWYTYQHFPWSRVLSSEQLAAIRTVRVSYDLVRSVGKNLAQSTEDICSSFAVEARKFAGVGCVVIELKEYSATNRSVRERDWDAAVRGVKRCFPKRACEVRGVVRGWGEVISPHITGEEVVFSEEGKAEVERIWY